MRHARTRPARARIREVVLLAVLVSVVSALLAGTASAATPRPFSAHLTATVTKPAPPTCAHFTCATGTVAGYGAASVFFDIAGAVRPSGNCLIAPVVAVITLANGSGTLSTEGLATSCTPGNSGSAPGALRSFGNPLEATAPLTVTGGTGVFSGATGTIFATLRSAGAHTSIDASGTIVP